MLLRVIFFEKVDTRLRSLKLKMLNNFLKCLLIKCDNVLQNEEQLQEDFKYIYFVKIILENS